MSRYTTDGTIVGEVKPGGQGYIAHASSEADAMALAAELNRLQTELDEHKEAVRVLANAIVNEPELPGDPPDGLIEEMSRDLVGSLRVLVVCTKNGIAERSSTNPTARAALDSARKGAP